MQKKRSFAGKNEYSECNINRKADCCKPQPSPCVSFFLHFLWVCWHFDGTIWYREVYGLVWAFPPSSLIWLIQALAWGCHCTRTAVIPDQSRSGSCFPPSLLLSLPPSPPRIVSVFILTMLSLYCSCHPELGKKKRKKKEKRKNSGF